MSLSDEDLASMIEDSKFRTDKTPSGEWEDDKIVTALVHEVKRLRGIVAKQANDGAKLAVDRDEWRDTSRDWRQRASRAEKVEAIFRGALLNIERLSGSVIDAGPRAASAAREVLRAADVIRVERVTGEVEVLGPDGSVHYRRPSNHPDVAEALKTPGYSVREATT